MQKRVTNLLTYSSTTDQPGIATQQLWQNVDYFRKQKTLRLLKKGVWAYFLLLVFEGAFRKWFLPGLAAPLLIIRDPLALWLLVMAWTQLRFRINGYVASMICIGVLGILTAVALGHGSFPVALFGARILLIHFPLIFIIGQIFSRDDVIQLGKITLWITIPMTVLIALQFYSPQSAWVNLGVAGDTSGAGFSGALGYFRPPGTFSFTNGVSLFYSFVACFVFYFWLNAHNVKRLLLIGATVGLLASIPLSISRGLFFQIGVTAIFTIMAVLRKPKYLGKMGLALLGLLVALVILGQTSFFQTSTEAFVARFETASESEGGLQGTLGDRFLGGLIYAIIGSTDLPFWGYGLGLGTNVGAQLISGERQFLVAEGEWGRILGELGLLLGLSVILLRISLLVKISLASYKRLRKGDMLPWLLLSFGFLMLAQGGWAQPTALGFSTLICGLMISSLKK